MKLPQMNRSFWIGLGLIVVSYGEWLVPKDWAELNHFAAGFPYSFAVAFFCFGVVFLCEGITQRLGGTSLLGLARGGGYWGVLRFVVAGAVTGVLLEVFGQWLGKLWYYAYYPEWFYWPALAPSFLLYWVVVVESYMAAKAVLERLVRGGGTNALREVDAEAYWYGFLGALGTGLFAYGTVRAVFDYIIVGGYTFNALSMSDVAPALRYIVMACIGLWLLAEAVLYSRQKPSLLRYAVHGYVLPLLAVALASLVLSVVWESQNAPIDYWVYTHWPWPENTFLGVQVSVLLMWPTHYLVFLAVPAALVPPWAAAFFSRATGKQLKEP